MRHRFRLLIFVFAAWAASRAAAGVLAPAQLDKLTPATGTRFGEDLSVDGTTAVITTRGAPGMNTQGSRAVHVYRKSGANWNHVKTLRRSDFARVFGASVSVSGDLLAVGAPYRDDYRDASYNYYPGIAGLVFIYRRSTAGGVEDWVEESALSIPFAGAPSTYAPLAFGSRVRLSGDTLVVSMGGFNGLSRLWVFRRGAPGAWAVGPQIVEPEEIGGPILVDTFNRWAGSFALQGNFLVAGPHTGPEPERASQLIVFERNAGGANAWGEFQRLSVPASGAVRSQFGGACAVSGNRIVTRIAQLNTLVSPISPGAGTEGFAIFERAAAAGSLFAAVHQRATSGAVFSGLTGEGGDVPGVAASGESVAVSRLEADESGNRVAVDVFTKTGASWGTSFQRTVRGGYVARTTSEFPIALTGTVLFTGAEWSSGESPHANGVVEVLDGVGAGPFLPLRVLPARPPVPGSGTMGSALFVNGTWLAAGDPYSDETFDNSGSVHVWRRITNSSTAPGEYWYPFASIKPDASFVDAHFGAAVAVDDSRHTMLIGSPDEPAGGSVYAFDAYTGVLTTLPRTGVVAGDRCGAALAQSGDFLAVGLPGKNAAGSNSGAVYIYKRSIASAPWTFHKSVSLAAAINASDGFGATLAMDGDTLAVAAIYDEDSDGDTLDGSVSIYMRNQGGTDNWGLVTTTPIQPSNTTRGIFGYSLALRGDDLLAGAFPFLILGLGRGEVFAFHRNQGGANRWGEVRTLFQPAFGATPDFGIAVALSGDGKLGIVGADNDDSLAAKRGAARCFDRDLGGTRQWTVSSGEDPWLPTTEERFGRAVSAGDEVFAVSAPLDDSAGTDAGAIYLYRLGAYERWASDVGIVGARAMPPEGDWDHDRLANLVEFAIGSNPRSSLSFTGGLTAGREADGLVHLRLTKPAHDLTGLEYTPEQARGIIADHPVYGQFRVWSRFGSGMERLTDTALQLHYRFDPGTLGAGATLTGSLVRLKVSYPR